MIQTSPALGLPPAIAVRKLSKTYAHGSAPVHALQSIDLDIAPGEFVAIMGTSGSGKSTLMNILGGLDTPTAGEVVVGGVSLMNLDKPALARFRNTTIGFVFQQFNLLPRTAAVQQVMLPLAYAKVPTKQAFMLAKRQLERVGLGDRLDHTPSELSGGQQQRVAIARALVADPKVILADEPTGALDSETSAEIMALLANLNQTGITVVVVTHDDEVARCARRMVRFRDGRIAADERNIAQRTIRLVS